MRTRTQLETLKSIRKLQPVNLKTRAIRPKKGGGYRREKSIYYYDE